MKSFIILLILIFIEIEQIITQEYTINGKNYQIEVEEGFLILEDTEYDDEIVFSSKGDKPVFLVKSNLKLGSKVTIKKDTNIDPEKVDPEKKELGLYSAIIVLEGGNLQIEGSTIETSCNGCHAITVIGNGEVNFYDGSIRTLGDNSAGLFSNFGGNIITDNAGIETHGVSSPNFLAKNSGKITASNINFRSLGSESPLIYSNGNIMTSFSDGKADKSKIVFVEGDSTAVLNTCGLEGQGVKIFNKGEQTGTSNFEAMDSELKLLEKQQPLFLVTNCMASIVLSNTGVCSADDILIKAEGMEADGADVSVRVEGKAVQGKAVADPKSSINFEIDNSLGSNGIQPEGNVSFK